MIDLETALHRTYRERSDLSQAPFTEPLDSDTSVFLNATLRGVLGTKAQRDELHRILGQMLDQTEKEVSDLVRPEAKAIARINNVLTGRLGVDPIKLPGLPVNFANVRKTLKAGKARSSSGYDTFNKVTTENLTHLRTVLTQP